MSAVDSKTDVPCDSIFIVDREQMMCELLQYRFESEGYIVDVAHDGYTALQRNLSAYSLIIVDLMDCAFTGIQFTRAVKSNTETYHVPIIILSARASEDDIVNGLDSGADDYLTKPFSSRELVARVRSVIRRHRTTSGRRMSPVMRFKSLEVDLGAGTAKIDGEQISLSRTEFLILSLCFSGIATSSLSVMRFSKKLGKTSPQPPSVLWTPSYRVSAKKSAIMVVM